MFWVLCWGWGCIAPRIKCCPYLPFVHFLASLFALFVTLPLSGMWRAVVAEARCNWRQFAVAPINYQTHPNEPLPTSVPPCSTATQTLLQSSKIGHSMLIYLTTWICWNICDNGAVSTIGVPKILTFLSFSNITLLEGTFPLVSNQIFCKPPICALLVWITTYILSEGPYLYSGRSPWPYVCPICTRCPGAQGWRRLNKKYA